MTTSIRIPIIRLYGYLIVSIQVSLSDELVLALKEDITNKIEAFSAEGLVIDLSGIDLMDSYISRSIRDIALISRLMGVKTVISGMDPLVAITLVEMGLELNDIQTVLSLEDAIELFNNDRKKMDMDALTERILDEEISDFLIE